MAYPFANSRIVSTFGIGVLPVATRLTYFGIAEAGLKCIRQAEASHQSWPCFINLMMAEVLVMEQLAGDGEQLTTCDPSADGDLAVRIAQ